jgi:hypothetical protein
MKADRSQQNIAVLMDRDIMTFHEIGAAKAPQLTSTCALRNHIVARANGSHV